MRLRNIGLAILVVSVAAFAFGACGGGGGGGDGGPSSTAVKDVPNRPVDTNYLASNPGLSLVGTWYVEGTTTYSSCAEDIGDSFSSYLVIQNHNTSTGAISGTVDGQAWSGTYSNGQLVLSGDTSYDEDGGETTLTQIVVNVAGTGTLSGTTDWTWDGYDGGYCEGYDHWEAWLQ